MKPSTGRPPTKAMTAGIVVDVHLDELDLAGAFGDDLLQDGSELLAGAAPRRPEIHQDRLLQRLFHHVAREIRSRRLLHQPGGRRAIRHRC
jgi:hypothetical protein